MTAIPEVGFLRLRAIIGDPKSDPPIPPIVPVSKSTWWQGVRDGRYPQPTRALGSRITAWAVADIRKLLEAAAAPSVEPANEGAT